MSTSIVIPTRNRPGYLESTLSSIVPQARAHGCEILVVDDSGTAETARAVAEHAGVRYVAHSRPLGANAARNTGLQGTSGELTILIDDDVQACDGWLAAFLSAAEQHPRTEVFAGAIGALLEGRPPRSCGRERPPITTLELGPVDAKAEFAWSANMAIRRSALRRIGPFDASLHGQGEEQEWQERLRRDGGGEVLYVAGAKLLHRREPRDARLRALLRVAYARGEQSRRFDLRRGAAPSTMRELATLLGCVGHVLRYRCPSGLTMVAHSTGRLREARAEGRQHLGGEPIDDFLSGESGTVAGLDRLRRELADRATAGREVLGGGRLRLALAAKRLPQRRVLALGVTREQHRALTEAIVTELKSSRHAVELHTADPAGWGKFENLNALLEQHPTDGYDWLIVFDDDIELPHGFLDRFLFLAERFELDLAQPAHRRASHAAWQVTRRRPRSVARETCFVEIGPLTAFAKSTFSTLLPFPPLRMGWGLEAHWAAIAKQQGWRCGVVDAVAIRHLAAPAASSYSRERAIAEARAFLADKPYVRADEAQRTLTTHRRW
ncbi:MAG TPA: glycosyltransferase family 2 protein [Solirubrobacteraceae bacterium]|jgi:GT2 family glycosyltransferase